MPIRDKNTLVHEYPLAKRGINLHSNILDLHPEEAIYTQNCYWKNGIVKRGGSTKFETDQVATGKRITGLHRFYYSTNSKVLLAVSGTVASKHDGATWSNVQTGLTDGAQGHFSTWGGVQKLYFSNGTDGSLYSWAGTGNFTALSGGNLPAKVIMTLPYQDRLLAIDNTNPGTLTWSAAFDDTVGNWVAAATTGVKPDSQLFGMVHHSINNSDSGYEAGVLLAGANGMYLFKGTVLEPGATSNYTIYPLATSIGCNAPRTMAWTPRGTIYLGIDKQVYLLPFNSSIPVPIGDKIRSNISGTEGIENIPSSQISKACAVYHDGFYKLSVTQIGQTVNKVQFWLDVTRLYTDEKEMYGPWYGPMTGLSISCFASQNGNGDSSELMAGEDDPTKGSYVYQLSRTGVFLDDNNYINVIYKSFYNTLNNTYLNKDIHQVEFEILETSAYIGVNFADITGTIKTGDTFSPSGSSTYWDDFYWGEQFWTTSLPTRTVLHVTPAIKARRLSVELTHSSASDTFELYAMRVKATENNNVFEVSDANISASDLAELGLEGI